MDLELLEVLALSDDRAAALAQLLPGSEDHDYFRCLHAQHAGALDEAGAILDAWPERHGQTERLERLRMRQELCRLGEDPASAADAVRDRFGVSHWHEAEVAEVDPTRPTRLAQGHFTGQHMLATGVRHSTDLAQITDDGLYELIGMPLDPARRRSLLGRIGHTPQPELIDLLAADLAAKGGSFGALAIHSELTLAQLDALAAKRPELRTHKAWIDAAVMRMRPPASVDLEHDRDAREAYLAELWRFVQPLPPASNSLKVHVLWHLLDAQRKRDAVDPALFAAYVQLPRGGGYLARKWIDRVRGDEIAELGADYRHVTGLAAIGSDEELVRDLLHRRIEDAEQLASWFDREWLDAVIASGNLVSGTGDADRATRTLGPGRAAALRERIDLEWDPQNPTRFELDEPIALIAWIKNVPELVVKVFRIDPLAYFHSQRRPVGTDLDLDGLAATHELAIASTEPPIRRVRQRIELPMCTRPGTYVVDLIGSGIASRVVVHKGRLRHLVRRGAAGHVVTLLDEAGKPRPDARAWIGDREYVPDERGAFAVPFSTSPGPTPMLLSCGDIATLAKLDLVRETYALSLDVAIDRQVVTAGRTARAIARVTLTVADAPASVALLERATWEITLTDRNGVATTKSQPLAIDDEDACVLEWPLGEHTARVAVTVRASVKVISEQREQELSRSFSFEVAAMHGTAATEALYLARTAGGFVLSALGKSGEPRARRPVTVGLVHRWSRMQQNHELATDDQGRIELGELVGAERITATLGALTQTWTIDDAPRASQLLCVPAGRDVVVPLPTSRTAAEAIRRASLVELRAGAAMQHVAATLVPLAGGIAIHGLPPGDYALRAPGIAATAIRVIAADGVFSGVAITEGELAELTRPQPIVAELAASDALVIQIAGATDHTRVHVIATRFEPAAATSWSLHHRQPGRRVDRTTGATYVTGRELGDEYRYILDRRSAKRFPGMLLAKPTLLLNPWARRQTSTEIQEARGGRAFKAAAPPAGRMSVGGPAQPEPRQAPGRVDQWVSYDFLPEPPAVIPNLEPDEAGVVRVPLAELGRATCAIVIVDDPAGASTRRALLPERPLEPRDLRLRVALAQNRHARQHKAIAPLQPGETLVIEDLATATVHLIDTVERAHAYLLALREEPALRELAFVTRWPSLPESERRELYSKHACHELSLFLYFKDRAFFDAVIAPYLAHKRVKTFVDHWLLGADLARYLEPVALARLNAVERALLCLRMRAEPALVRLLADEVTVAPPDPSLDGRLIDALLGAATLDGDQDIELKKREVSDIGESEMSDITAENAAMPAGFGGGPQMVRAMSAAPPPAAPKRAKVAAPRPTMMDDGGDGPTEDLRRRAESQAPMYRSVDRTQEWAEHNWWHRTPGESGPGMIEPNRLWRDLAQHAGGPFLSPWLGLATGSFAEAMCALAVIDLPFAAASHAIVADGPRLAITAAGNALAGSSQLVDGELVPGGAPLVVGQAYVRADDRHRYVDGEQVDHYVEGPMVAGVVYTCLVVLANPTSSRQRISALIQIPRGSIAVAGARPTQTIDVLLDPYGTHGHEYSFYFPATGSYTHFPVHVTRGGVIVAAAAGRTLEVGGAPIEDPKSWPHVSQRGSLAEVVAFLADANLASVDLERIAWRLREREGYDAILGALERRRAFHPTLWAYALLHGDRPRIRAWLRAQDTLLGAGPVLDMPIVELDAEALGAYEHLELAPLVNARAHRLGPKLRILNDGLAAQYRRFLDLVAHRRAPTAEDLLAATSYLLAQDRHEAALAMLTHVKPDAIADRMQYDYLAAFAACLTGELPRARELAAKWRELPVDRWRRKFEALLAMLDELAGAAPAIVDPDSREQQQGELAAKQPAFELAVDRDGVVIHQQNVAALELRYFEIDVELLFSRQPFVQSDLSRFSFIEPKARELVSAPATEHRASWPAALRGKNVVVEAVGAGLRKAKLHYANDLVTQLAHQYGQLRLQRASDRGALPATYVKVYARQRGGAVSFYKDGYTDLRGWFDYATLSTDELDRVERFAILVCSDHAGAAILEAGPPAR